MSRDSDPRSGLDDTIIVDEIGIESGGYGIYRLRSLYQPIYERRGKLLRAVAVEGTVAPYVAGEAAPRDMFLAAVSADDRDFVERMELALPLRNHGNIGLDTLELVVGPEGSGPEALIDRVRLIGEELAEIGMEPSLVVCAFGEQAASDGALPSRLAEEARRRGLRVAIGDFGAGHWTDDQIDLLNPEIVRIDSGWFQKVCRDATTVRLFDAVVSRLHERKSKVLVTGIETEQQLGVALRAGADLLQGEHLASPALVGAVINDAPLSLAEKLGEAHKIVSLFG